MQFSQDLLKDASAWLEQFRNELKPPSKERVASGGFNEDQKEALFAAEPMSASRPQVKAGAANATQGRASLRRIVASVDETAAVISGISAAAIEQAAVSLRDKSEGLRRELTGFIADHA